MSDAPSAALSVANVERGELTLVLDGMPMVLRPSYEAIEAFELATGKGLLDLARDAISGKLRLGETAQIVCECVKAWGRATGNIGMAGSQSRRIADLILEAEGGFHEAQLVVSAMLSMATTGGYTSKGEPKPVTTTMTMEASVAG